MAASEPPAPTPVSDQPEVAFAQNGILHFPPRADLPTDACVKCGRKSIRVVKCSVRNPRNPLTWYAPQAPLEIGLCSKHTDERRIWLALTGSLLAVGVVFGVFGISIGNFSMILLGLTAVGFSGFFRARNVIYRTDSAGRFLTIQGAGTHFLKRFPLRRDRTGSEKSE